MEPEVKLMSAIFGRNLSDGGVYFSVDGVPLSDAIISCLEAQRLTGTPYFNEREKSVLAMRFGFDAPPCTLTEVGKELRVTGERIRQIEARALRKLRHPIRTGVLRPYIKEETCTDTR